MRFFAGVFLLCGVAGSGAAADTSLGRLFFTPEQRLLLDRQREYAGAPEESTIRLGGRVTRPHQDLTVWINGRVEHGEVLGRATGLRVGESFDPVTHRKTDLVPDGSVTPTSRR